MLINMQSGLLFNNLNQQQIKMVKERKANGYIWREAVILVTSLKTTKNDRILCFLIIFLNVIL
jgi:hypothetical protein